MFHVVKGLTRWHVYEDGEWAGVYWTWREAFDFASVLSTYSAAKG